MALPGGATEQIATGFATPAMAAPPEVNEYGMTPRTFEKAMRGANGAATHIQSCYRRHIVSHTLHALNQLSTMIQSNYRGKHARRRVAALRVVYYDARQHLKGRGSPSHAALQELEVIEPNETLTVAPATSDGLPPMTFAPIESPSVESTIDVKQHVVPTASVSTDFSLVTSAPVASYPFAEATAPTEQHPAPAASMSTYGYQMRLLMMPSPAPSTLGPNG